MKIGINNRVVDMPLRCFEFSATAKENTNSSQSAGAVQSVRGADTPPVGQKPHKAILHIGNIRWYILEGQKEGDDFIMYGIACGMTETEYGYISLNELTQIEITHQGKQYKVEETYPPFPLTLEALSYIDDELRSFLDRLYNEDNQN